MSLSGPITFILPGDLAVAIGKQLQGLRLSEKWSRKTLASLSGVPAPTIRHFESTGKIGFVALLQLADALHCLDHFSTLFPLPQAKSIEEFMGPKRQRGK
jgi:transcriptional regulator with XRE-family HTH domain